MREVNRCVKTLNSIVEMVEKLEVQKRVRYDFRPVKTVYGNEYVSLDIKAENVVEICIKKTGNIVMTVKYNTQTIPGLSKEGRAYSRASNHKGCMCYTYGYSDCTGGADSTLFYDLQQIL